MWKALRGHSVTFAVLLACALLGVSVIRWLKEGLYAVGTPWLVVFLLPTILIGVLAKKERVWVADEARRKLWARCIVGAALLLTTLISLLTPEPAPRAPQNSAAPGAPVSANDPAQKSVRPRGPSGK